MIDRLNAAHERDAKEEAVAHLVRTLDDMGPRPAAEPLVAEQLARAGVPAGVILAWLSDVCERIGIRQRCPSCG